MGEIRYHHPAATIGRDVAPPRAIPPEMDPTAPARGLMLGLSLSSLFWLGLAVALRLAG